MSEYIVPAQIDAQARASIQEMSGKIFNLVGCRDLARADFILDQTGNAYFLEINTIPGFTATSLLPMAALQAGFDFENLCLIIAGFAAQRKYASCDN
jgi:D-alanine-D-alanine ligase